MKKNTNIKRRVEFCVVHNLDGRINKTNYNVRSSKSLNKIVSAWSRAGVESILIIMKYFVILVAGGGNS